MDAVIVVIILMALGMGVGKAVESSHYKSIHERESRFNDRPAVTFRTLPDARPVSYSKLVVGNVAISVDYWKRFLAGLRLFFGGELHSYSPLFDRGRREALLRLKESCPDADLFMNLRFETLSIWNRNGNRVGSLEVLAYATAIRYADEVRSEEAG